MISSSDKFGEAWFDFAAIADLVDTINIMSYEVSPAGIGWTGSKQPVSGGGKVGKHPRDYATVLQDYIQATGKPEKLLLGIDNGRAGTEWDCKTDQPQSPIIGRPRPLKPAEAAANAEKHGRKFDAAQKAPWYCYASGDHFVQGWYEDDEAQAAKFALLRESKIGGVCIWVLDGANEPPATFKLGQEFLGGK